MLTESELRELLRFISPDPVLSVYLNTDPSKGNKDSYRLRLRNLLKGVTVHQEVETIERYFQSEYDWTGRSVALFSCVPQKFFRVYPLALPVPDFVHISDRPSVRVLADLLDSYGGYGVILVDKQGARAFSFHLGELQEQEGMMGEAVKRVKHGGASTFPGRMGGIAGRTRHQEQVVERNMKDAVDFSVNFFNEYHVRRILIGGTDDNVALFRSLLPKSWQSLIVGTFPMNMTIGHTEVFNKAMQIGIDADKKRVAKLISNLVTQAAKASGAVVGVEPTLQEINRERVDTLVVMQGLQQPAYQCKECSFLTTRPNSYCANCGSDVIAIPDAIDIAVSRTMRRGGDVEVVHESHDLEQAGKVGAFLRY
jgi:peptide subunit release factor 1 (eRF1)